MAFKKGDIYLGAAGDLKLLSPFGRKLTIKDDEIARTERTASGRLVKDIVATKKKFTISYSEIKGTDLETILDIYDIADELILQIWNDDQPATTTTTSGPGCSYYDQHTVLMEPIDRTRLLLSGEGLWTGVSIELNEV